MSSLPCLTPHHQEQPPYAALSKQNLCTTYLHIMKCKGKSSHTQQHSVCCGAALLAHINFMVMFIWAMSSLILSTALLQGCTTCTTCSPTPSCTLT